MQSLEQNNNNTQGSRQKMGSHHEDHDGEFDEVSNYSAQDTEFRDGHCVLADSEGKTIIMDPQKVLESLAREKGVSLTNLGDISSRFSQSGKIACCGGLMTRLVTESAADSTVLLCDGSGSCYCALHGEITNRYPDVLTTGALLLFTDVTVLVLSSNVPPLLVACLQNMSGLLLPDEVSTEAVAAVVVPTETAVDSATAEPNLFPSATAKDTEAAVAKHTMPSRSNLEAPLYSASALTNRGESSILPELKRMRLEATSAIPGMNEDDDDDDAECLELVDQ